MITKIIPDEGDEKKIYDWIVMPDMFFAAALIVAEKIPPFSLLSDVVLSSEVIKELKFRSAHANYELIRPVVFNFK